MCVKPGRIRRKAYSISPGSLKGTLQAWTGRVETVSFVSFSVAKVQCFQNIDFMCALPTNITGCKSIFGS